MRKTNGTGLAGSHYVRGCMSLRSERQCEILIIIHQVLVSLLLCQVSLCRWWILLFSPLHFNSICAPLIVSFAVNPPSHLLVASLMMMNRQTDRHVRKCSGNYCNWWKSPPSVSALENNPLLCAVMSFSLLVFETLISANKLCSSSSSIHNLLIYFENISPPTSTSQRIWGPNTSASSSMVLALAKRDGCFFKINSLSSEVPSFITILIMTKWEENIEQRWK